MRMRQLTSNVYAENEIRGCNHGFVTTSDGIVMIHMPGHTPYQAAVVVEEEGVVFTSDNIFCRCQTWIQEGDPDLWYQAIESLRALPQETFVPGHGPFTGKEYLDEQKGFIQEW